MNNTIPKKIHYCWFGGNPKNQLAYKCINSWKKLLPEYEIVEWNESNYDISSKPLYVRQAYEQKKWAFVSDYARFDILYNYGGLYFDVDVELIRKIDDVVKKGPFLGCEQDGGVKINQQDDTNIYVNPGLGMGAYIGLSFLKEVIESYQFDVFINSDGTLNQKTIVLRTTEILQKKGLQSIVGIQNIDGITIYPKEYFCPIDSITGITVFSHNTRTIHHFAASWMTEQQQKENEQRWKMFRKMDRIDRIKHFPNFVVQKVIGHDRYEALKSIVKREK